MNTIKHYTCTCMYIECNIIKKMLSSKYTSRWLMWYRGHYLGITISCHSVWSVFPPVSLTLALTIVSPDGRSGNSTEAEEPTTGMGVDCYMTKPDGHTHALYIMTTCVYTNAQKERERKRKTKQHKATQDLRQLFPKKKPQWESNPCLTHSRRDALPTELLR